MKSSVIVQRVSDLLAAGCDRRALAQAFVHVNVVAWPPPVPERYLWTEEKVLAQFSNCPHLLFCAFIGDKVVGTLSMIHISEKKALATRDWEEMSADGTLSTHDADGDCAFGVDLSVIPGAMAGDALIEKGISSAVIDANKKGVFLGSRAPKYNQWAHKVSIEEFVGLSGKKNRDPEVRLYQKEGFRVVKVIPGYMEDPDSQNYGILMFWDNPSYTRN